LSNGLVCGPNISTQLIDVIHRTKTLFAGWSNAQKENACNELKSISTGTGAWDISELHERAWIASYRPACATRITNGYSPCEFSVQVGNGCHFAGAVNYVIFGVMCKLCYDYYEGLERIERTRRPFHVPQLVRLYQREKSKFGESNMISSIYLYKMRDFRFSWDLPPIRPHPSYQGSRNWAVAGYRGWPAAPTPPVDRPECSPTCSTRYPQRSQPQRFHVHWGPISTRDHPL
jgi:hypothetical protein